MTQGERSDDVERVARAICAADNHEWPKDDYNGRTQIRCYMNQARAAIAALPQAGDAPDLEALLRLFDAALTTRARAALLNGADRHYDDMAPAYEDAREAEAAFKAALAALSPRTAGDAPLAYAWEYHGQFGGTVIRLNHGEEVNGGKPIRAIPLYAQRASPRASVVEECARVAESARAAWINGNATTSYGQGYQKACSHITAAIRSIAPSAEQKVGEPLRDALTEVMQWIHGWDPNFIHDDEWPATAAKVKAALAALPAPRSAGAGDMQ